jgi:hypothetical protein
VRTAIVFTASFFTMHGRRNIRELDLGHPLATSQDHFGSLYVRVSVRHRNASKMYQAGIGRTLFALHRFNHGWSFDASGYQSVQKICQTCSASRPAPVLGVVTARRLMSKRAGNRLGMLQSFIAVHLSPFPSLVLLQKHHQVVQAHPDKVMISDA